MANKDGLSELHFVDKHHNNELVEKLNLMRANGTLVDLWPTVEGMEFPAHSTVLASCSDFFMAMCGSNMIPKDRRVHIKDISATTFAELLSFMYSGEIKINQDNVEDLLRGSSMLLLEKVRKRCCSYLNTFLNESNCLGILCIADELSCEDLANRALKFTQQYFGDVWLSMEFVQLPFHLVSKLVASDATSVPSEDIMYAAVLKWVTFNESREMFFADLFLNVRLRFVSEQVLEQEVSQEALVIGNQICMQRLKEVKDFRQDIRDSLGPRRRSITSLTDANWLLPRLCMSEVKAIVAVGGVNAVIYNAETNDWMQLAPVTTRHCPGMGVLDNDLILIGGSREWKRLAAGVRYVPKRNEWLGMAALNQSRSNFELQCLDGFLYAVGGYDGDSPLSTVERFSSKHNRWEFVASMNHARDGLCVVSDDEYLYAISGYNGKKYLSSVERYDPERNVWETKDFEPIQQYRECASSVISDGKAYVLGGYFNSTYLRSCEVYDIENNEWSDMTPMAAPRYQTGAAILNRWIFVCGGWTENGQASALVECYHIDEDCWFKLASLPTPCTIRCSAAMFPRKQFDKIVNSQEEIKQLEARKVAEDMT